MKNKRKEKYAISYVKFIHWCHCPDYFQTKMNHSYYDLYIKRQNYLTELVDIFIQTSFKNKIYNLYAF